MQKKRILKYKIHYWNQRIVIVVTNNSNNDYHNHQNQINSLVLVNGNHKKEQSNNTPFSDAFTPFTPSHTNKSITSIDDEEEDYLQIL